jgi:hypothetical protein
MPKDGCEENELNEYKRKADCLRKGDGPFCFKIPSDSPLKKGRIFSSSPFSKGGLRRILVVFYMDWVSIWDIIRSI